MTGTTRTGLVFCACLLFTGATESKPLPAGFRLEPIYAGFDKPSSLAFLPGSKSRILITERTTGDVLIMKYGEMNPEDQPACHVDVYEGSEDAGLLGVAVHPAYGSGNNWIYLYYTPENINESNFVARFVYDDQSCTFDPEAIPLDLGRGTSSLNNGGGMAFGPDGWLYIATGDVENHVNSQQSSGNYMGKILRVREDLGEVSIYSLGVRDGHGVAVNGAGGVYATDAGAGFEDDELNAVKQDGNLGWDHCPTPGSCEDPLGSWSDVDIGGLAVYGESVYPDPDLDGEDNDGDKWGGDRFPGVARIDDDGTGICVGSADQGIICTIDFDCPPRSVGGQMENSFCEMVDEADEWCPGGLPLGDDACGDTGPMGVDEPDESFFDNLFVATESAILRATLTGTELDALSSIETFLDSSAAGWCPAGWTDIATGPDGFLYVLSEEDGDPEDGAIWRIVHDSHPGSRILSPPKSPFPVRLGKGESSDELVIYFENLRTDAEQPSQNETTSEPQRPVPSYIVWKGTDIANGSYTVKEKLYEPDESTIVSGGLRKATLTDTSTPLNTFLSFRVTGTRANLESRPAAAGEDVFHADLCENPIGFHEAPDFDLWKCGQDFTVLDQQGELRQLYDYRDHVILLNFCASWVPLCQIEADALENLYQDYKDRRVMVLTVLVDEDNPIANFPGRPQPAECRNWQDRAGADHTFPCWVDRHAPMDPPPDPPPTGQQAWPKYNKFGAIPTNVILDTGLQVVYSSGGFNEAEIRTKLDRLVGTSTSCLD